MYPKSARSGFKPFQFDMAWYYIKLMNRLGAVSKYNDCKKRFYAEHLQSVPVMVAEVETIRKKAVTV